MVAPELPKRTAARALGSRRWLLLGAVSLVACGVHSTLKTSSELRADIQKELQVDANVSVNEFGGKVVVTITFQARPAGDLDVARDRAAAMAHVRLPHATRVDVFTRL